MKKSDTIIQAPAKRTTAKRTKRRENITIIPARFNDTFKRVTKKETYCKLVMLADDTGTIIIRLKQLADFLNTSDKTISKNLIELHNSGLIIKGKTFDQYGYQAMMIHIIDYNKLSENNTTSNQNIAGQILNKQFYETRLIHENEKDIHETWNNFHDTEKIINETGSPYNEIQENDKRIKTDDKSTRTPEHVPEHVFPSDQVSQSQDKPPVRFSVSDSAVFGVCEKTTNHTVSEEDYDYILKCLTGFNMPDQQAKNLIEKYGYDVVIDKINYVKSRDGIDNKGGYLTSVLKAYGKKNGLSPLAKPETPEEKQAVEAKEKLAQVHLVNIRKWFSKHYLTIESYINNPLVDQKGIIFELSKILQGNVLAGKNETVNELLNGELITIGRLHKLCDQLMGAEQTNQEASKTIVSEPVEKASEVVQQQEPNKRSHTPMSLNERLAKVNRDLTNTIVGKTSLSINQKKEKTAAEKEAHADKQRQIAEAILANKSLATDGLQLQNDSVNDSVPCQLNQAFIQNSDSVKINSDSVNVQSQISNVQSGEKLEITTRQQEILDYIKINNTVDQKSIENKYPGINEKTIRRDIKALLNQGLITWTWENRKKVYR